MTTVPSPGAAGDELVEEPPQASRAERKRASTRASLVYAAAGAFADKRVDGATIADITQRADVGLGTFYNYFDSKEEIAAATTTKMVELLGAALRRAAAAHDRPDLALAAAVTEAFRWYEREPVWGPYLLTVGLEDERLVTEIGWLLMDLINRGATAGVFHGRYAELATVAVCGVLVAGLQFRHAGATAEDSAIGFVSHALRLVGIEPGLADEIAAAAAQEED